MNQTFWVWLFGSSIRNSIFLLHLPRTHWHGPILRFPSCHITLHHSHSNQRLRLLLWQQYLLAPVTLVHPARPFLNSRIFEKIYKLISRFVFYCSQPPKQNSVAFCFFYTIFRSLAPFLVFDFPGKYPLWFSRIMFSAGSNSFLNSPLIVSETHCHRCFVPIAAFIFSPFAYTWGLGFWHFILDCFFPLFTYRDEI